MIGNDIVDLKQATQDSNWKRARFLEKVFTSNEQMLILSSENKEQIVWLLWSMKEAAYKAYVRETNHSFFNPKRIQCQLVLDNQGTVCISEKVYYSKSLITSDYIHSIATKSETTHLEVHLFKLLASKQSETLKANVIRHLSFEKAINPVLFKIEKTALGVPNVYLNNEQILEALTISHHGNFGAFAMC